MAPESEPHARSQRAAQREADATQANIRRRHHPKKENYSTLISQHQKTRNVMMYQAKTPILKNWILVLDVVLDPHIGCSLGNEQIWILVSDEFWDGSWRSTRWFSYTYIQMTRLFMLSRPITVNGIKTAPLVYEK